MRVYTTRWLAVLIMCTAVDGVANGDNTHEEGLTAWDAFKIYLVDVDDYSITPIYTRDCMDEPMLSVKVAVDYSTFAILSKTDSYHSTILEIWDDSLRVIHHNCIAVSENKPLIVRDRNTIIYVPVAYDCLSTQGVTSNLITNEVTAVSYRSSIRNKNIESLVLYGQTEYVAQVDTDI